MKRVRTKESLIFAGFLTSLVATALTMSFSYNFKTRLVPVIVGSISLVLCLVILAGELVPRFRQVFEIDMFSREGMVSDEGTARGRWEEKTGLGIAIFWVLLFAGLLFLVGFNIAIPICVLVYVRVFGKQSWMTSLAVTAIVWGFIYILFQVLMDYALFQGVLFGGIV